MTYSPFFGHPEDMGLMGAEIRKISSEQNKNSSTLFKFSSEIKKFSSELFSLIFGVKNHTSKTSYNADE